MSSAGRIDRCQVGKLLDKTPLGSQQRFSAHTLTSKSIPLEIIQERDGAQVCLKATEYDEDSEEEEEERKAEKEPRKSSHHPLLLLCCCSGEKSSLDIQQQTGQTDVKPKDWNHSVEDKSAQTKPGYRSSEGRRTSAHHSTIKRFLKASTKVSEDVIQHDANKRVSLSIDSVSDTVSLCGAPPEQLGER